MEGQHSSKTIGVVVLSQLLHSYMYMYMQLRSDNVSTVWKTMNHGRLHSTSLNTDLSIHFIYVYMYSMSQKNVNNFAVQYYLSTVPKMY